MANPRGCRLEDLRGLEEMLELKCPSLAEFENDFLWAQLDHLQIEEEMKEMRRRGSCGLEIRAYYESAQSTIRREKGPIDPLERAEAKKQLWVWEEESFDPPDFTSLSTPYDLWIDFFPKLIMVKFLWRINLEDDEFCRKHLGVGRDIARFFAVDEVLYVTDSAYPCSVICSDYVEEDFEFQKGWLRENLGASKARLQAMEVELDEGYTIEGYYLDQVS